VKTNYLSYLLRVWQTGNPESSKLVASLEDPHSHQVMHFGSLETLMQYLLQITYKWGNSGTQDGEQNKERIE